MKNKSWSMTGCLKSCIFLFFSLKIILHHKIVYFQTVLKLLSHELPQWNWIYCLFTNDRIGMVQAGVRASLKPGFHIVIWSYIYPICRACRMKLALCSANTSRTTHTTVDSCVSWVSIQLYLSICRFCCKNIHFAFNSTKIVGALSVAYMLF